MMPVKHVKTKLYVPSYMTYRNLKFCTITIKKFIYLFFFQTNQTELSGRRLMNYDPVFTLTLISDLFFVRKL